MRVSFRVLPVLRFAALLLPFVVGVQCGLLDLHEATRADDDGGAPAVDSGVDAGGLDAEAAAPPSDPCGHASPPPRPNIADDLPGSLLPTLTFAMRRVDLTGHTFDGGISGYDLDGFCTCDSRPGAKGSATCTRMGSLPCDYGGGVDNAVASLFSEIGMSFGDAGAVNEGLNREYACGLGGIVILVDKYNGQANDSEVFVRAVTAAGIYRDRDGGAAFDAGDVACPVSAGGPYPARWDGDDVWMRATKTPALPFKAYVADSTLVIDLRTSNEGNDGFPLQIGGYVFSFGSPVLTARIVPVGTNDAGAPRFELHDGVIQGRVKSEDVASVVGRLPIRGQSLCSNSAVLVIALGVMCGAVDTVIDPRRDSKGDACNALSFVLGFSAEQAHVEDNDDIHTTSADAGCAAELLTGCK